MLCQDAMLTLVFKCREDTTATLCAQMMREHHIGFVPVVNADGAVVGVVTDRDLALRVLGDRLPPSTPVAQIMTPGPLLTCRPDENLHVLEDRMAAAQKSRALVVDKSGRLVGIISLSDIAQAELSTTRTGQLMKELTHRESAMIARP